LFFVLFVYKVIGNRIAAQHFGQADEMNFARERQLVDFRVFKAKTGNDFRQRENLNFRSAYFAINRFCVARSYNRDCVRFDRYFGSSFIGHYFF